MGRTTHVWCWLLMAAGDGVGFGAGLNAQVFVVGEKSATADVKTDFKPTRIDLPTQPMTERGRRELIRDFSEEQGFAHRELPLGTVITLNANGTMTPGGQQYKALLYKKGEAAKVGDRVIVTALEVKGNRILVDLNGGPHPPHRLLNHIQIGVGGAALNQPDAFAQSTGCRIELVFEGGVPEVSGPEMKALLSPIVDFGVKTGDLAYAETLPAPVKGAIDMHEVLVGMNRRMVLASVGEPESKIRESNEQDGQYEDWVYGHQPQTVKFVRFAGDRVIQVKVAALGQPMVVRTEDEMGGYKEQRTRNIVLADGPQTSRQTSDQSGGQPEEHGKTAAPTLKLPTESRTPTATEEGQTEHKVQYPSAKTAESPIPPASESAPPSGPVRPSTMPSTAAPGLPAGMPPGPSL